MTLLRRIVMLGTGTGVGKTWVGAALVSGWARSVGPAFGQKPLESGIGEGRLSLDESDAAALDRASSESLRAAACGRALHAVSLPEPLSPHLAARRAGVTLDLGALVAWTVAGEAARLERLAEQRGGAGAVLRARAGGAEGRPPQNAPSTNVTPSVVMSGHEMTPHVTPRSAAGESTETATVAAGEGARGPVLSLVETAGGACSPMTEAATNLDFARALAMRGPETLVVLVAPDRLGVLHDVGAALHAAAATGVAVERVVLSAPSAADDASGSNAEELVRVVFPLLGPAAPRSREVLVLGRGVSDAAELARRLAAG